MTIVSFHETEPTPPLSNLIVDRNSAIMNIAHEDVIPLYANHRDICRFPGKTGDCQAVCRALRRITYQPQNVKRKPARTSTHSSEMKFDDIEKSCMMHFDLFNLIDYKRRLPKPIEGTCQWIRVHSSFVSWYEKAENALLWLTGYPGCGKTMLSYSVARQLEEASQNVLIYFCDNKICMQKDAKAVLIGLIGQIVHRHRAMVRHIRRVFEVQGTSMLHSFSALWSIFERILKDWKSGTLYVIIDALDECEVSSCHDLLGSIYELIGGSSPTTGSGRHVKFLLTSRPTLGQVYVPSQFHKHQLPIDDGQPGYGEDVRIFVQQKVEEITLRHGCPEETKSFLLQALLSRADQTFLWIHMVLASLERSFLASINDFRNIIAKLPPALEVMYLDFLSAIPSDHQYSAWKLLKLLFASSRTLLLDEVNVAFTIKASHRSLEDVLRDRQPAIHNTILGVLGPLVRVSESKVSLVHQTVKDFLLVEDGDERARHIYDACPGMPAITVDRSELCMASACIHYLLLNDFSEDLYSMERSPIESSSGSSGSFPNSPKTVSSKAFWDDDILDLDIQKMYIEPGDLDVDTSQALSSKYSFYNYSSLHWAGHFALCESSAPEELRNAAKSLLDGDNTNCRNWLRFYRCETSSFPDDRNGGSNPIALAAYFNLHETLSDFLENRELSQLEKDQALFWGAEAGHSRIIATLLEAGANPDYHAVKEQTALTTSAANGHMECVAQLLDSGRCDLNVRGKEGRTALSFAAGNGHNDVVKYLLSRDVCKAEEGDKERGTPLMWAVRGGHSLIVSMLAEHPGVDINRRDQNGRTAVSWAAGDGMEDVLKYLLKRPDIDANLQDNKTGKTPLIWAATNGHAGTVRILVRSKKVDTDKVDYSGRNAISLACEHGHEAALRVLLKHGCKGVNDSDVDGWTPMAWAVHRDRPGIIEALIAAGVNDLERRDPRGRTVLSWAVEYGHLSVVRVLLREGANPETAIERIPEAQTMGRYDLVNELQLYLNKELDIGA
ncbi:ankyrin repeat-containing domain protein [Xylaria sp. FL0933]|nr:ankyrin repeat-containing domain protein [Xylaria sp. FL0933]